MNRTRGEHSVKGLMQRAKYEFARKHCHGARVLDIGCGSGFGAELLNEVADSVLGIDCDVHIIREARRDRNAWFQVDDASEPLPWLDHDYDVVTAIDVIEHMDRPSRLLDNIVRAMAPEGMAILTTPNVHKTHNTNPHHVHEYYYEELFWFLRQYFDSVLTLTMQKNDKSNVVRWLRDHSLDFDCIRKLCGVPLFEELTVKHYPITMNLPEAYSFIVVCRGAK